MFFFSFYRLAGIIAADLSRNHFLTYYKSLNATGHKWLICDDMNHLKILSCSEDTEILPTGALYVRIRYQIE